MGATVGVEARMKHSLLWPLAAVVIGAGPAAAAAPAAGELQALIECRSGQADYNALATALSGAGGADARRRLGLKAAKSSNPFLAEFTLAEPVSVFGRKASRIAFNSAGIFALLDGADPRALARELGVAPELDTPAKFMGEKLVREDEESLAGGDVVLKSRITLNVSTVSSHPGVVLAGCGYQMDVAD
jgi:hypothetical protein